MAAVAMLSMNACNQDEEVLNNPEQKGEPVEFVMGINSITKTLTEDNSYATTFIEGDEVGIFAYNGETEVAKNARYKYTGGAWVAQDNPIYAEEEVSYSYYAYYPYNAEASDVNSVSLSVAADQTSGYTASDALIAKSENVTAGTTTVDLSYTHAFAMVQVALKGTEATKEATVTLQNIFPTAAINLKTGVIGEASGTLGTVAMKSCSKNGESAPFSYRAIVPEQTITANNSILVIASGEKKYKFTYTTDVPYESGKLRQYDVTLGDQSGTALTIGNGTISNWEDASEIEGGESEVGEVIDPTTSLDLSSLINADMTFTSKGTWSAEKLTDKADYWFTRTSETTTVSYDATEEAIKAENTTDRGAWGTTSFGYHCGTKVFEKTTYRLTFDAKSTIAGNQVFGVGVRNSSDQKGFRISNLNNGLRNQIAVNFTADEVEAGYKTITVDVDFSQASATTNLNNNTFEATVDSDLEGITILFFNNLNQDSSESPSEYTTYFKNIKFEKVVE